MSVHAERDDQGKKLEKTLQKIAERLKPGRYSTIMIIIADGRLKEVEIRDKFQAEEQFDN